MYQAVFIAYLTQGLLLGLVVLALLAAVPKLQKRYGPRWLCRLWVTLAVLFLVPVRALVPQAPAAVSVSAAPLYTPVTVLQEETTQKPAGNVPYRTTTAADNTTHYIVPRTEIQTGRRTILERLAINTTRGNLAALVWELGILAVAVYQFGGYAVWRIRVGRNAQPVAKAGVTPCRRANARKCRPRRWCAAPWWRGRCILFCWSRQVRPRRAQTVCWPTS